MRARALFTIEPIEHEDYGCPCDCSFCRGAHGFADVEAPISRATTGGCFRETPEAQANIAARAVVAQLVERQREPSFYERHMRRPRRTAISALTDILKDHYGSDYKPYRQNVLIKERRSYEMRREAFMGVKARPKDKIAEEIGYDGTVNLLYNLMYAENPFFALMPKEAAL